MEMSARHQAKTKKLHYLLLEATHYYTKASKFQRLQAHSTK